MARHELVNGKDLIDCGLNFKDHSDYFHQQKVMTWCRKFGQFQTVVVAEVDRVKMIVDGSFMVKCLKELGYEVFQCHNLGEMKMKEFILTRLAFTSRIPRLNYVAIAEAINMVCETENDVSEIATFTHIKYDEVQNYKQLLTFDWEAFMKAPLNVAQIKLFEDER